MANEYFAKASSCSLKDGGTLHSNVAALLTKTQVIPGTYSTNQSLDLPKILDNLEVSDTYMNKFTLGNTGVNFGLTYNSSYNSDPIWIMAPFYQNGTQAGGPVKGFCPRLDVDPLITIEGSSHPPIVIERNERVLKVGSSSHTFDGDVVPIRFFIEIQAPGGAGAADSGAYSGGGGGAGGYWAGILDFTKCKKYCITSSSDTENGHVYLYGGTSNSSTDNGGGRNYTDASGDGSNRIGRPIYLKGMHTNQVLYTTIVTINSGNAPPDTRQAGGGGTVEVIAEQNKYIEPLRKADGSMYIGQGGANGTASDVKTGNGNSTYYKAPWSSSSNSSHFSKTLTQTASSNTSGYDGGVGGCSVSGTTPTKISGGPGTSGVNGSGGTGGSYHMFNINIGGSGGDGFIKIYYD